MPPPHASRMGVPGYLAGVNHDGRQTAVTHGTARGAPIREHTGFPFGSITVSLTSTLVMQQHPNESRSPCWRSPPTATNDGGGSSRGGSSPWTRAPDGHRLRQRPHRSGSPAIPGRSRPPCARGHRALGYDDIAYGAAGTTPLTTIRQSRDEVGQAAVPLLLDKIADHRQEQPDRPTRGPAVSAASRFELDEGMARRPDGYSSARLEPPLQGGAGGPTSITRTAPRHKKRRLLPPRSWRTQDQLWLRGESMLSDPCPGESNYHSDPHAEFEPQVGAVVTARPVSSPVCVPPVSRLRTPLRQLRRAGSRSPSRSN